MSNSITFLLNLFSYNFYNQTHHIWDVQRGWSMLTDTTSLPLFCSYVFAASAGQRLVQAAPAMHCWEEPGSVILLTPLQVLWGLLSASAEATSAPG